jgi:hypothetical protein
MKELEQTLSDLTTYIVAYDDTSHNDGENLNFLLKKIITTLAYLETHRAHYKLEFEKVVYELTTDKGMPVNRAINFAENRVPELYMLRRIMDSGYKLADVIRTNISFIKHERNHAN